MIHIDFTNAMSSAVSVEHGITPDDIKEVSGKFHSLQYNFPFLEVLNDTQNIAQIKRSADAIRCRFQNLVVFGIGGSALGLRTLSQAILPPFFNMLDSKARQGFPRLFVCDNIDPDYFGALLKMLDWKETCVNIISKSGKTVETVSQFYIIKDILLKKLGAKRWKEHVVITTDATSGPLRMMITEEQLQSLSVPEKVGGRFSVLTSVGLLPSAAVGIDVDKLLSGASKMAEICTKNNIDENPALKNAVIHYIMDIVKHKPMSVMMPYSDSLALFADWYAQLWAESLGKEGKGPTPLKALGATDQHSQLQLYMEGPNDKIITFVGVDKFSTKLIISGEVSPDFSFIKNKDLSDILHAEQRSSAMALREAKRPNITINLPELSEYYLGQLLVLYEMQTALAGQLYGVNPFDQPGVELGKKLTKEILINTQN